MKIDPKKMTPEDEPVPGEEPMVDESGEEGEEAPNVTPEEQEDYDHIVVASKELMFSRLTRRALAQKLATESKKSGLGFAIGHTVAMVIRSVSEAAKREGHPVSDDVLFAAGQEVVADLVEFAIANGIAKESEAENLLRESAMQAINVYGDIQRRAGEITPEDQQQARADMAQLQGSGPRQSIVETAKGMTP
jgi:hypothetical protein